MVFIDNLAFSLFSLSFAGFLLLYVVGEIYLVYRRGGKDYAEKLAAAKVPLAVVGLYMVLTGLWGQFTWPLPGSYNILFYDPLVAFGMVTLAFGLCIHYRVKFQYMGFLGLMVGLMVIAYGVEGYGLGLTQEPLALLGMYFLYGIAGIFSYPVALVMERLPGLQKHPWMGWTLCIAVFWLSMLAASALAGFVGVSAIGGHLASAP